jgi:hypothetical protein
LPIEKIQQNIEKQHNHINLAEKEHL